MANAVAWFMFFLGIGHIGFGLVRFNGPVLDAVSAGLIGQFAEPEVRRTAFWFLIFGPLLMLAGHVGLHAVAKGDLAPLLAAPVLIAVGYGWIPL